MIGWLSTSFTGLHEKAPCNDRIAGLLRLTPLAMTMSESIGLLQANDSRNDEV